MCGIIGILGEETNKLDQVLNTIGHRGEGHIGKEIGDSFAIACNRLCIVDIEKGQQPISNEKGDKYIIFNGEIYNYKELKQDLKSHEFRTDTDTEVLLHLWEDHRENMLNMLDGMFSFLIYDSTTRDFIAARDPLGIKPLYYTKKDETIYIASEIKALLSIDPSKITAMPPGCYLTKQGLKRFYSIPGKSVYPDTKHLKTLIQNAIAKRCNADVPIGIFLSGGLDSSTITKIASEGIENLKTFTVGFDDAPDVKNAEKVAQELGTDHHTHILNTETILKELPKIIWHLESFNPNLVVNAIPNYFCAKFARKHVKV